MTSVPGICTRIGHTLTCQADDMTENKHAKITCIAIGLMAGVVACIFYDRTITWEKLDTASKALTIVANIIFIGAGLGFGGCGAVCVEGCGDSSNGYSSMDTPAAEAARDWMCGDNP